MAITGFICFCPDFRIYHFHQRDDSKEGDEAEADYKFTEPELENVVAAHLSQGNKREAEFVAKMTGFARLYPHKIVEFSTEGDGGLNVKDPEKEPEGGR